MRWLLASLLVVPALAVGEPFDGVSGRDLPPSPACYCVCPPELHEEFAQCFVYTQPAPFHCLAFCRHHRRQAVPVLPGGVSAWRPQAVQQYPENVCPRGTGAAIALVVRSADDYTIDSHCWTP